MIIKYSQFSTLRVPKKKTVESFGLLNSFPMLNKIFVFVKYKIKKLYKENGSITKSGVQTSDQKVMFKSNNFYSNWGLLKKPQKAHKLKFW